MDSRPPTASTTRRTGLSVTSAKPSVSTKNRRAAPRSVTPIVQSPPRKRISIHLGRAPRARVIDVDRLPLRVELDGGLAHLALADAGRLGAAEWHVSLAPHGRRVDVHDAGL